MTQDLSVADLPFRQRLVEAIGKMLQMDRSRFADDAETREDCVDAIFDAVEGFPSGCLPLASFEQVADAYRDSRREQLFWAIWNWRAAFRALQVRVGEMRRKIERLEASAIPDDVDGLAARLWSVDAVNPGSRNLADWPSIRETVTGVDYRRKAEAFRVLADTPAPAAPATARP